MAADREKLSDLKGLNGKKWTIHTAGKGQTLSATQTGKAVVTSKDGSSLEIDDVLYIPEASANLLSLNDLCNKGWTVQLNSNGGSLKEDTARIHLKKIGQQWILEEASVAHVANFEFWRTDR